MCIYYDGNSVFRVKKTTICNAKFGDLGDNGDRRSKYVVIIKGSLLLSAAIVKHFRSKKNYVPFWVKI